MSTDRSIDHNLLQNLIHAYSQITDYNDMVHKALRLGEDRKVKDIIELNKIRKYLYENVSKLIDKIPNQP